MYYDVIMSRWEIQMRHKYGESAYRRCVEYIISNLHDITMIDNSLFENELLESIKENICNYANNNTSMYTTDMSVSEYMVLSYILKIEI